MKLNASLNRSAVCCGIGIAVATLCLPQSIAQDTGFNFQGRLKKAGNLQTTAADLKFRLYDADSGGSQVGSELVFESGSAIPVTNGLFSVTLDFGAAAFDGTPLWLEMDARVPSGDPGGYGPSLPRQPLTSVPYANLSLGPWVTSGGHVFYTAGNVGIGTTGPASELHIRGTGSQTIQIDSIDDEAKIQLFSDSAGEVALHSPDGSDNLRVRVGNADRATFTSAGQVGIGTTAPGFKVSLGSFGSTITNTLALVEESPGGAMRGVGAVTDDAGEHGIGIWASLAPITPSFSNTRMYISANDGHVNITGQLTVGSCAGCSDRRFKTNVECLGDALGTLCRIRGVRFDWKRDEFPDRSFSGRRQIGFVAQELLDVVPEVVHKSSDGYYAVDYGKLTPLLVEAIKELSERHDKRVAALSQQLEAQAARIERMEALIARLTRGHGGPRNLSGRQSRALAPCMRE